MENNLYDLVLLAQNGDEESLNKIILTFLPSIKNARKKIKFDNQDDLEQIIVEKLIEKIISYDIDQTLDFTAFCSQIKIADSKVEYVFPLFGR